MKTAIVTGSSRGIGRAIAERLARGGMRVVVTGRDEGAMGETVAGIRAGGGEAVAIALDLREEGAAGRLVELAMAEWGRIDVVVNNAGATKRGAFEALGEEDWADGFALKFFGAVRVTRAAWGHLKTVGGSVVFISGSGGRTPGAQFAIGGSVNAALLSLTKALAEQGIVDGVQVNCVNPGTVRTERFEKRLTQFAKERGVAREVAEGLFVKEQKVTRIGEPEDIAGLVAFVVSEEGRFLQGALIDADGGATKTV